MINFLKGVRVTTGQVGGAEGARDELWVAPPNTTVSFHMMMMMIMIMI